LEFMPAAPLEAVLTRSWRSRYFQPWWSWPEVLGAEVMILRMSSGLRRGTLSAVGGGTLGMVPVGYLLLILAMISGVRAGRGLERRA